MRIENPNISKEKPRLRIDDALVYALYTLLAGVVAAVGGKRVEKSVPPQIIERIEKKSPSLNPLPHPQKETVSTEDEKFQKMRALMQSLVASFDRGEHTIAFPLFDDQKAIDALSACTLIDSWYKQENVYKNIQLLWTYLQKNKDTAWNEDVNNSLLQGLRVSRTVAQVSNKWFIPKKFWVPTELRELESRMSAAIQKTPTSTSSCGDMFSTAFNYLAKEGAIGPMRESLALFIKGSAKALVTATEGKNIGNAQEEIESMHALVSILNALPDEKR